MKDWSTACPNWERRIVARESLIALPPLFPTEAADAWAIVKDFRLADIGGATVEEAVLPWTKELIDAVFGAYNAEDGRRYINEFFLCVSKKNGKSTIASAIMLGALVMNWRPSAELLILSPTKEIADNSYKPIRDMIKADEELSAMLKVQDYFRTITHMTNGTTLKVVAADSDAVSGKKASFVFVDELHEFGKQPRASNMLLEATGGLASRAEGFVIYATTQSEDPPAGVFKEKLDYARKVRDGVIKDRRFLPLIYEFPKSMIDAGEHRDLENAYVTNPNWGASVDSARIEQLHSQATEAGEGKFREFLSKHLNVEIGLNLRSDRWAGAEFWEAAAEPGLTYDAILQRSEVVVVGIDGGGLDDLLGLAILGREKGSGKWLHWAHAWAHEVALSRRKDIAARLKDFENSGSLTIVKKPGQDTDEVADLVSQIYEAELLPEKMGIGVDAAGIVDIVNAITTQRNIPLDMIVAVQQGFRLNGAIKTAERKVAGRDLLHCGQDLMAWSVGNARIEDKGNAILVTKQASGKAKIDPLMATFNCVSLMALNPASRKREYQMLFVG